MAGVDSLLRMLAQHAADELRLGTDEPPRMFQKGSPLRLSIPPTDDDTLRHLLGPILTPERDQALRAGGKLELSYTPDGGEPFSVTLQVRGRPAPVGVMPFEAIFRRGGARPPAPAPSPLQRPAAPLPASPVVASMAPASPAVAPVAVVAVEPAELPPSLRTLLQHAASLRASDLHLYSGEPPSLRIDGRLRVLPELGPASVEESFACFLGEGARAAVAAGRSLDLAFELPEVGRFRVNLYRASDRLAAAVRVLPRGAPALADLHFPVALDDLVDAPHGLVIVCGPTGSGKSATLAALAEEAVRRRAGLLISLEDPIEYGIRAGQTGGIVRQRQIGADVRDFPTGLRDALREDPDLLLIGEMRDPETISLALTAAETGHLVLTSLHSRSTSSSIERIVDSYPPERQQQIRVQLADSLRAVVAQRLIPRARGAGRIPAVEILRGNHTVANLIREGKTAQLATVLQSSRKDGMLPLERSLADLVRGGQIARDQALAVANDPSALASYLTS